MTADAECLAIVRRHDKDRFLSTLFAPEEKQPHLFALYAFNAEVARVRDVVTEPQLGLIRLQWWRDTVDGLYTGGGGTGHPVAEALERAIVEARLPRRAIDDLITAHEFDLFADQMGDLTALEAYLGETSARLIQMAAMILAPGDAHKLAEPAGLAGVAHGLSQILMDKHRRAPFLPKGMTVTDAIAHASRRLAEARAAMAVVPQHAFAAFLPARLTPLYLSAVEKAPDAPVPPSQFRRQLSLWWSAKRERL
jgi:15-cis-phytoene synthase